MVRIESARTSGFGSSASWCEWGMRATNLDKRVHGENDELGLRLGVVHEVEVHELFLLNVFGLHVFEHVGEQGRHVFADGHIRDHPLDRIFPAITVLAIQVGTELVRLAFALGTKVARELHGRRAEKTSDPGSTPPTHARRVHTYLIFRDSVSCGRMV